MALRRSSGVLLHPGSLPGGRLGPEAYRFVDWLEAAGQSWWQILPLGPPDRYGSPYAARSAFAGWPGLCAEPDAAVSPEEADAFRARHAYWLDGWARYAGKGAVAGQVRFEREWLALRRYAAARGIRLIGDIPLYVADRSADVASHPELFDRSLIGGVPPDLFAETGQLWGSPIYAWPAHRAEGYRWWIERFRRTFELVDVARLDHFRGFVAYWAVPAGAPTAESGRWLRGPGLEPFRAVEAELGGLPLIAEDLGVITPPVERLREAIGAPGMRILQFGFGNPRSRDALANHPEHCVVYTGTHDNEPIAAWWRTAPAGRPRRRHDAARRRRDRVLRSGLGADRARVHLARPGRRRADAGRAGARQQGPHEPSGHARRQLEVAARGRGADRRARGPAPASLGGHWQTPGMRRRHLLVVLLVAVVAAVAAGAIVIGSRGGSGSGSAAKPKDDPVAFLKGVVGQIVRNDYANAWSTLHPAQQRVVSKQDYVRCELQTKVIGHLDSLTVVRAFDDLVIVAGAGARPVPSKVVTFRLRLSEPGVGTVSFTHRCMRLRSGITGRGSSRRTATGSTAPAGAAWRLLPPPRPSRGTRGGRAAPRTRPPSGRR